MHRSPIALGMLAALALSACHSWRAVPGLDALSPDTERVRLLTAQPLSPTLTLDRSAFDLAGDTLVVHSPSSTRMMVWDVLRVEEERLDGVKTFLLASGLTVAFFHIRVFFERGVCVGTLNGHCRPPDPQ